MKQFLSRLSSTERRFVVGVVLVVFVVLNVGFVWPHFSDWTKMKDRLMASRKKLAAYQDEINQVATYRTQLSSLEEEGASVSVDDQAIDFMTTIQMQAADAGVNIMNNSRTTTSTNQFFVELTQGVSVQGTENQLVNFFYNLGSDDSTIRVRDLALRPDPQRQLLNANMKLVVSYQKTTPVRPSATAAATASARSATTTKR